MTSHLGLKIILPLLTVCVWSFSFYMHFIKKSPSPFMIAFVGRDHSRLFERAFHQYDADLWVFGHHKRRSKKMIFENNREPFDVFRDSDYKHLLVVHELYHIPMIYDASEPLVYIHANKTIGSLWPVGTTGTNYTNSLMSIEKIFI